MKGRETLFPSRPSPYPYSLFNLLPHLPFTEPAPTPSPTPFPTLFPNLLTPYCTPSATLSRYQAPSPSPTVPCKPPLLHLSLGSISHLSLDLPFDLLLQVRLVVHWTMYPICWSVVHLLPYSLVLLVENE